MSCERRWRRSVCSPSCCTWARCPLRSADRSLRIIDKESRRLSFLVDSILSFTHAQS